MIMEDVMTIENGMTIGFEPSTSARRYHPSPIGNVVQVYDEENGMYLGHIVCCRDVYDRMYVCTRIDAHDCDESHWRTTSYADAVAFVECAQIN